MQIKRKKENDPTGDTNTGKERQRELSTSFSLSTPIYIIYALHLPFHTLVQMLWYSLFLSEFPPYFCYPKIWVSHFVLSCDSCAVLSGTCGCFSLFEFTFESHYPLLQTYPSIHLAIWGLSFWAILSFSPKFHISSL